MNEMHSTVADFLRNLSARVFIVQFVSSFTVEGNNQSATQISTYLTQESWTLEF
jgi:hypothetical protein